MNAKINKLLIPNVSKLPDHKNVNVANKLGKGEKSEFNKLFKEQIGDISGKQNGEQGIRLSTHASRRLQERNLEMDSKEFFKLKGAIDKLKSKGGKDSLVITGNAAYIIDVDKNTIVTAIDKESMGENVFTKIDSTLIIN